MLAGGILLVAGFLINNNHSTDPISHSELSSALEHTIVWMDNNEESILKVGNPILWYRIKHVAELTQDERLKRLFNKYKSRYLSFQSKSGYSSSRIWKPLFYPSTRLKVYPREVESLPAYLKHWIYALHCADNLAEDTLILEQNDADYCGANYLLAPTCTAHQVSGVLFLLKNKCIDSKQVEMTIAELQTHLVNLLRYDPRVVDIYVQRALKLAESGAPELLEDIWLRRILNAQLSDGGWANFDPVIPLGNDTYLGFGYANSRTGIPKGTSLVRSISIGEVHSTFHATTQGLMLLALLQNVH